MKKLFKNSVLALSFILILSACGNKKTEEKTKIKQKLTKIKELEKPKEPEKPKELPKPTETIKPAKSTEQPKKEDTNSLNEYNTGITFEQISKNPNQFKGKKVKFTGVVDKVVEQAGAGDMRFWIDNNANKAVYGAYINSTLNKKITEKTKLTIYGVFMDIVPYLADFGDGTTPYIIIDRVEWRYKI